MSEERAAYACGGVQVHRMGEAGMTVDDWATAIERCQAAEIVFIGGSWIEARTIAATLGQAIAATAGPSVQPDDPGRDERAIESVQRIGDALHEHHLDAMPLVPYLDPIVGNTERLAKEVAARPRFERVRIGQAVADEVARRITEGR